MSWTRTILYGAGLAGVFFFYFGPLIVGTRRQGARRC